MLLVIMLSVVMLGAVMLGVVAFLLFMLSAVSAECHYAECRGALQTRYKSRLGPSPSK
jgi:hypothetical protein